VPPSRVRLLRPLTQHDLPRLLKDTEGGRLLVLLCAYSSRPAPSDKSNKNLGPDTNLDPFADEEVRRPAGRSHVHTILSQIHSTRRQPPPLSARRPISVVI
jgi:hypothetical protein